MKSAEEKGEESVKRMRLDKYLCDNLDFSRSEIKNLIKKGLVSVDDSIIKDPGYKVSNISKIVCNNEVIAYSEYRLFCLNKPSGYVTANDDKINPYVMQLIKEPNMERLFAIGRLDKDTKGLLLITDDGNLAHALLSPSKHVKKTYLVAIEHSLTQEDIRLLEDGVDIGDDKPTKPARVRIINDNLIELEITEGRYHQVKRMLAAVDNRVCDLTRISFGNYKLPENLAEGSYISIKKEDVC